MDERPVEVSVEFIQHISEQLNSISSRLLQRPQESEADCLYYRLESVVRVLRRLAAVVSLPREDEIFNVLYSSLEHLSQADLCVNFAERGPTMTVGKEQVQFLLEQHFKVHDIARMYGVSYSSIRRWMKRYKLSVRQTYSDISSEDFKSIINNFIGQCPNSGYRIVVGHLRSLGIRVARSRVLEMIRHVDPVGTVLRSLDLQLTQRRPYSVPGPLSLWHMDGNHKLVRWRIVVHGGIDGYSRKIMYLKANSNNKAASVLDCFLEAVHEHGLPHRNETATSQEKVFITRELSGCGAMCGVICNYYSAFRHLEELSLLDPDQDLHLICLHYIMLPRLNHHLQMFTRTWDNHSLSTEGNMSPSQLWLAGHVMNSQLFLHTEDHRTLGIDWDAPVAVPDPVQEVILPEPPLALQDIINSHLSLTIDPLMLQKCNTEADFNEIKSNLGDWISECGVPSIFSSTFQDVTSVFTQILKHYIYHRVASMVQQFKAGMNSCNLFWEKVATDWHEFLPIFTHTSVRLSRTVFRELFYVKWTAEGSNRREKEEDTMYQWECLLMSIQEGETTDITFEELLTFATGADAIPPLDFPHKCSIEFMIRKKAPADYHFLLLVLLCCTYRGELHRKTS
ncbi:hypothetical protein E1301_Tti023855 [Triplophysa tibetana]|uniref:Integrase core domain-containing protein n=1 Tax=Triplophysa tibetana TaxID=1572043 RepID=A0A5A9MVD6_9TELE|nr:hypothetical protein E1301_Tti023855 [Triplophysa tibetana]